MIRPFLCGSSALSTEQLTALMAPLLSSCKQHPSMHVCLAEHSERGGTQCASPKQWFSVGGAVRLLVIHQRLPVAMTVSTVAEEATLSLGQAVITGADWYFPC